MNSPESIGIVVRWAILAGIALLLWDNILEPPVLGLIAIVLAINLAAIKVSRAPKEGSALGTNLLGLARYCETSLLCLTPLIPVLAKERTWLLVCPLLVADALLSRNRSRFLRHTLFVSALTFGVASFCTHNLLQAVTPVAYVFTAGIVGMVLAEYQARDEVLVSRDERLKAVLDCGSALAASADIQSTILHTLKSAISETGASCGYVLLVHEGDTDTLVTESAFSAGGEFEFPRSVQMGQGKSGFVAKMAQPVCILDSQKDAEGFDGTTVGVRSAACVPLITRSYAGSGQAAVEQVLGVMTLLNVSDPRGFNDDDMELLRTLAALMAVAVLNERAEEKRRNTFLRTLESLATALEARDEYTQGHSQRVSEVSLMIGERMGFSSEALEELRIGTILHDIGKIGVPDEILNKKARLTDDEFETMKAHPVIGYEICKPLMLTEGVLMIIRNHHEKLDGSGYPDGLKGGELPLSLRIVCVADAFDAMSSRRPYRGVMEEGFVLSELSRCAGTQFDPDVVENLKEIMESDLMIQLYSSHWASREAKAA